MAGHTHSHASELYEGNALHPLRARRGIGPMGHTVFWDFGFPVAVASTGPYVTITTCTSSGTTTFTIATDGSGMASLGDGTARNVRINGAASSVSGTATNTVFVITGTNILGDVISESIDGPSGGGVASGAKGFSSVTAAVCMASGRSGDTATDIASGITIGFGNILGLPYVSLIQGTVVTQSVSGVENPTFVAAATGAALVASGADRRGTVGFADALATTIRPTMFMHVDNVSTVTDTYGQAESTTS